MEKKDLEKLGIVHLESKIHPKRFFVPLLGEVDLNEPYEIKEIFEMLYRNGEKAGIEHGKHLKISEIKKALDINDFD